MKNNNNKKWDYKILQVMPLPKDATVMLEIHQQDGKFEMIGEAATSFKSCLALVEYDSGTSDVVPYDLTNHFGIEDSAEIVKIRHCPKCGREMIPYRKTVNDDVRYHCLCGSDYSETFWEPYVPGEDGYVEGPQGEAKFFGDGTVSDLDCGERAESNPECES